jgi:hypothetical protein
MLILTYEPAKQQKKTSTEPGEKVAPWIGTHYPRLPEMKKAHRKFIRDYNCQIHFAHREPQDNRHSPQDVLRGVLARTLPAPMLARIFFATEFTRHLDRSGYIRFRRWRISAEEGLARQRVQLSIYTSTRHRSNIRTRS